MSRVNARAYNRDVSKRKARRKRKLDLAVGYFDMPMYSNLHQYSKNKIHCSCSSCSGKTRNKGKRRYRSGNYDRSLHYSASDLRRVVSMDQDELETMGVRTGVKRKHTWS